MADTLEVNDIYLSLQGESTHAGRPCVFVRLKGCNLRCAYCDSTYAYDEGTGLKIGEVAAKVEGFGCGLVEVTGGEPLIQPAAPALMENLLARGYEVMLETNGTQDVSAVPPEVIKVMDIKCPGSGEHENNRLGNIRFLNPRDNVKFVITDREDYEWARGMMEEHDLADRCEVLFSPAVGFLSPAPLAEWILEDALRGRFQAQLHKILWGEERRR